MKTKKLKQDLFIILISSFVVIVCWIGFNIYNSSVSSTIDKTLQQQIIPIIPSFDLAVVENAKKRQKVTPLYESSDVATDTSRLSPTPIKPEPTPTIAPVIPNIVFPQATDIPATNEGVLTP